MASTRLVETIAESFGQRLTDAKKAGSTTFLSTPDGFLYAFVEDPEHLTRAYISTMVDKGLKDFKHIVILTSGKVPTELLPPLHTKKISVIEGAQFSHLLEVLGVQGPTGVPATSATTSPQSVLPTAQRLDRLMHIGKEWSEKGIPALSARFYADAVDLKPEFVPAYMGLGESYMALGLNELAKETFDRVLRLQEGNVQARVARARLQGLAGRVKQEIADLKSVLRETPGSAVVRAHLLAALVEAGEWQEALEHVDELIRLAPREGRFHAMRAACLYHLGMDKDALREARAAVATGMVKEEVYQIYETMHQEPRPIPALRIAPPAPRPAPPKPAPPSRARPSGKTAKKGAKSRRSK
jgi:hypothetical protein